MRQRREHLRLYEFRWDRRFLKLEGQGQHMQRVQCALGEEYLEQRVLCVEWQRELWPKWTYSDAFIQTKWAS